MTFEPITDRNRARRAGCRVASAGELLALLAWGLLTTGALACSDTGTGGWVTDGAPAVDLAPDGGSGEDAMADLSVDVTLPDVTLADVAVLDGASDGLAADSAPDAGADAAADGGPGAPLWGYVSSSVEPGIDGKGSLYVIVLVGGLPMHTAYVAQADLSVVGAQIKYEVWGVPAGTYVLSAFLDDNDNTFPALPLADVGDMVVSAPPQVTLVTGVPLRKDLVLDKIEGGTASNAGALKGKVSASAAPTLDGVGALLVTLHAALPPAGQIAATTVNNADLSSPFSSAGYYLGAVPPGQYYLQVFLDDNGNTNPFTPAPDKSDLIHSAPIQVHVIGGVTNVQDVVLDKVQ